MKLSLTNVGRIGTASVEINGITVIAGENNTGKSTVGKALYCLFSAFHDIDNKIDEERRQSIYRTVYSPRWRKLLNAGHPREFAEKLCADRARYVEDAGALERDLEGFYRLQDFPAESAAGFDITRIFERVLAFLKMDDTVIKTNVLRRVFASEYNMQLGNVNSEEPISAITLEIQGDKRIAVEIVGNENITVKESINIYSNLAYIEDPFAIDEFSDGYPYFVIGEEDHRSELVEMLARRRESSIVGAVMEEIAVSEKLGHIFDIINGICEGALAKTENGYAYKSSKYETPLALSNISTGLKTFLIIKTLLMNGAIEEGGTIILDEPEIHLHPEWQLLFAELIVLLHREFGLHVLLNTHSPYFLRAIQVYSAKYHSADVCKYYLSEAAGERVTVTDVTDRIDEIYVKLSRPLQRLEDERWQDDV